MPQQSPQRWSRMIALVDMNAFFASIEQLDHPEWRGRPIAVTNGAMGSCIITCSYEARAYGIKTGMRLQQARVLAPHLIQAPSRPQRYTEVSTAIMRSLQQITPDIEVFSVDEAFLDLTHCQLLWGSADNMARLIKHTIYEISQLHCSIGISADKTTAKWAAKQQKPNGITIIPPQQRQQRLAHIPVTELCGIASGIGNFLAQYGVHECGDMQRLPPEILTKRFGPPGKRIWLMAQGLDPEPLATQQAAPKSVGHGKIVPPNTRDRTVLGQYWLQMSEKVAQRLRSHQLESRAFYVAYRSAEQWHKTTLHFAVAINDGVVLYRQIEQWFGQQWHGEGVFQVQVTAQKPLPETGQGDLFTPPDPRRKQRNAVLDQINQRFGSSTLHSAKLINHTPMPNVIAPAWRPDGIRQTI